MYDYKNRACSHAKQKKPIFNYIMNLEYNDATVVNGAQAREDVEEIVNLSGKMNIPCILIDNDISQLNSLPCYEKTTKLLMDASNIDEMEQVMITLKDGGIENPLIYDNLSGHPNRLKFHHMFHKYFDKTIFYLNTRAGTRIKIREEFKVAQEFPLKFIKEHGTTNYLVCLEKRINRNAAYAEVLSMLMNKIPENNIKTYDKYRKLKGLETYTEIIENAENTLSIIGYSI